jgi:CRP-like cAMP-binding protein
MVPPDALRDIAFLKNCAQHHLQKIASLAEFQDVPANVVVFREGRVSPFVYLVTRGNVSLEIHVPGRGPHTMQTVGCGELLGWSPVVGSKVMTATARTLAPTRFVALPAAQLQELLTGDEAFGVEFLRRTVHAVGERLEATRLQLLDVYGDPRPGTANTPDSTASAT